MEADVCQVQGRYHWPESSGSCRAAGRCDSVALPLHIRKGSTWAARSAMRLRMGNQPPWVVGMGTDVASRGLFLAVSVRAGESHILRRQPSSSSFSWLHCEARGILGSQPGIKPAPSAWKVWRLDLQMARGVPTAILLNEPSFLGEDAGCVSVKASIVLPQILTWSPSPQDLRP